MTGCGSIYRQAMLGRFGGDMLAHPKDRGGVPMYSPSMATPPQGGQDHPDHRSPETPQDKGDDILFYREITIAGRTMGVFSFDCTPVCEQAVRKQLEILSGNSNTYVVFTGWGITQVIGLSVDASSEADLHQMMMYVHEVIKGVLMELAYQRLLAVFSEPLAEWWYDPCSHCPDDKEVSYPST
jgi:hypothetical protein